MTTDDLRGALQETAAATDMPHVERLAFAAAIIATALERAGMTAMLVGGGAIEFYAPGAYTTADIDLVVQGGSRERLAPVFESLGLTSKDRHWFVADLWVEVPGTTLDDPYERFDLGPFRLRVVRKEIVLAQRIIGFRYWKYWAYGLQAIAMIRAFGEDLDGAVLGEFLRRDQAEPAYEVLAELARSGEHYSERDLDQIWHSRYR